MAAPTDSPEALVARYRRSGDPEALGEIFDRAAPRLFRLAVAILQDASLAEDALQDAFLDAFRHLDRYDEAYPLMPWLVGILQRSARKLARRSRRRADPERLEATRATTVGAPLAADERARLHEVLARLEEPYRSVAVLHWHYGLTPAEIAHVRDQPPGTVRSLLSRARERLSQGDRSALGLVPLALPRGLDTVRETVLVELGSAQLVSATSLVGTLIMIKKPWLLAGLVLALVGAGALTVSILDLRRLGSPVPADPLTSDAPWEAPALKGRVTDDAAPDATTHARLPALTGTVIDMEDAPVAGARVYALPASLAEPVSEADLETSGALAVSDADGRFRLEIGDAAAPHTVVVRAEDGACGSTVNMRAGTHAHIRVIGPGRLAGQVFDLSGRKVADADLSLRITVGGLSVLRRATSDPGGSYEFAGLPLLALRGTAGIPWHATLVVEHAGHAPLLLDSKWAQGLRGIPELRPGDTTHLDIVLDRGATLRGRVLEQQSDRPLAGACVLLWSNQGPRELPRSGNAGLRVPEHGRILAETVSAEDGTFSLEHVPAEGFHRPSASWRRGPGPRGTPGPIAKMTAAKAGFAPAHQEIPRLAPHAAYEVVLRLSPSATIAGRVVASNGQPAEGVLVRAEAEGHFDRGPLPATLGDLATNHATTGPDGTFRISGVRTVPGGAAQVRVTAQRDVAFPGGVNSIYEWKEMGISVRAGEVRDLDDIVLPSLAKLPRLDLRLVTPEGTPVAGAFATSLPGLQRQRSDARGRVRLWVSGVWAKDATFPPMLVRLSAAGRATSYVRATPWRGHAIAVEVVMPASHRIAGEVVDASGQGVGGARVTVTAASGLGEEAAQDRSGEGALAQVLADDTGRFEVRDLPAGSLVVAANVQVGWDSRKVEAAPVTIAAGTRNLRLELPENVAREPFRGHGPPTLEILVREAGTNAPVAIVGAELTEEGRAWGTTPIRPGVLALRPPPDGTYTLRVSAAGFLPVEMPVRVLRRRFEPPLDIALDRGVTVRGRVTLHGAPVANRTLTFGSEVPGGSHGSATIRADGTYEVSGLAPGRYRFGCRPIGRAQPPPPPLTVAGGRRLVIPPGARLVTFDVSFVPAGLLVIEAHPPRGEPRPRLEVLDEHGAVIEEQVMRARMRGSWEWTLTLLPGDFTVRLHMPDGTVKEQVARVEAGRTAKVALSFD